MNIKELTSVEFKFKTDDIVQEIYDSMLETDRVVRIFPLSSFMNSIDGIETDLYAYALEENNLAIVSGNLEEMTRLVEELLQ